MARIASVIRRGARRLSRIVAPGDWRRSGSGGAAASARAHGPADIGQHIIGDEPRRQRQQLVFRGGYGRHRPRRIPAPARASGWRACPPRSRPARAQRLPQRGQPAVVGLQSLHQRVQADRIGTGHGLDQRREQVFFLVLVVMDCSRLEIAQQAGRRALRAGVAAMLGQMPGQPAERGALTGDAAMTGRQQGQGLVGSGAGAGPPGKLTAMAISQSCGPPLLSPWFHATTGGSNPRRGRRIRPVRRVPAPAPETAAPACRPP